MRRSLLRQRIVERLSTLVVDERYQHGGLATALQHIASLDLVRVSETPNHLAFVVDVARSVSPAPMAPVGTRTTVVTAVAVMVAFVLRDGMQLEQRWTDLDLASDLAEDLADAVLLEGDDWSADLDGLSVEPLRDRDDVVVLSLAFRTVHDFGA